MFKSALIITTLFFLFGCKTPPDKITDIKLETIKNENSFTVGELLTQNINVITFLSPECPLSENYTKTLSGIQDSFKNKDVRFFTIFPGTFYSQEKILQFISDYKIHQINLMDRKLVLTSALHATTTPETFILNKNGEILYSGAIDNWATELGEKRQVITEFYLIDALTALVNNQPVKIPKTTPVGCFIEMH